MSATQARVCYTSARGRETKPERPVVTPSARVRIALRYTATGTQDGALQDLPPSGRTATWTGVNIFRIECGRIVEIWSEVDALSRSQQLTGTATSTSEP
jgi:hypothetical protein